MNNSIENKVNNSLIVKDDILHKPNLSRNILKIKEKISKKKETNNVREEKFRKHIDAFADKKDVSFTNKSIFGTNFSPNKENIYCALGFLLVNLLINNDGSINIKSNKIISKANLWSYIYYLRLNNKSHPYFLQNLGEGNKVSPLKFYSMIATNKKSVTKQNLIDFIQTVLNSGYKVTIPFLQEDKHVISLVNSYHNNIIKNNTNNVNDDETINIKIIPSVKIIGNSNNNTNSKDSNIRVTLDVSKNSNNALKNSTPKNNNNTNTQKNINNKSQINNNANVNTNARRY